MAQSKSFSKLATHERLAHKAASRPGFPISDIANGAQGY